MDASTIIGGPAIVTFDGAVMYSEGDVSVSVTKEFKDRSVSAFGIVDKKLLNVTAEISFKPTQWKDLTKLFPHLTKSPGTRLGGGTDKALVIQTLDGQEYTYSRAILTGMPTIGLGVEKDLIGDITFRAFKANATAISAANSVVAVAANAFADVSFDAAKLLDLPVSLSWGGVPFDSIETEDGIDVSFNMTSSDESVDSDGIIDVIYQDLEIVASFIPVGMTDAEFLDLAKMQGTGVVRGGSVRGAANDLVATASGIYVKATSMIPRTTETRHGVTVKRPGSVEMVNVKTFTSGAVNPIAVVAESAPPV